MENVAGREDWPWAHAVRKSKVAGIILFTALSSSLLMETAIYLGWIVQ